MSGISASPLTNGGDSLIPGMIVRQISGGAAATVTAAQANSSANAQGNLLITVFSTTAPGGFAAADIVGRHRVLLVPGLTLANGQVLYLSAALAGFATNVKPAIAIPLGTVLDSSAYSTDNSVIAVFGPIPSTGAGSPFFELSLSFGGGPSGSGNNILSPTSSTGFFMRPTCNTSTMFIAPDDGTQWEWECPIDATVADLQINAITYAATAGGVLTAIMTINGVASGTIAVNFSAAGIAHVFGLQMVAAGQTVGIKIIGAGGGGSTVQTDFTARLRVS